LLRPAIVSDIIARNLLLLRGTRLRSSTSIRPVNAVSPARVGLRRIAWCEPFWVGLIGLLLLLPPRFFPTAVGPYFALGRPWLVLLLFAGWPVRRAAYGQFTRRTPLDGPLLLLVLWLPVTFWASADQTLSWEAISYFMLGLASYFALLNWPLAQRRPQIVAWWLILLGVGLALVTPLLSELAQVKLFRVQALEQLFQQVAAQIPGDVNVNRVAGTLVLIAPVAVALFVRQDWSARRSGPWLCGLAAVMMLAMLVLTQSRNAYLAIAIAIAVILMLRWPRLIWLLPVLLMAAIITIGLIGPSTVLEAILSGGVLGGLDGRLELWSRAWYALNDFPFSGIGIGTFERVIPVLYPLFSIGPDVPITHAHNLLLQIGVDLGLPGLIAYLAALINVFALLIVTLRQRSAALDWTLAAGVMGGLIALLIHGIFDAPVWGVKPAFIPWLLVALALLVGLRAAERSRQIDTTSP
jgi:putative inorganic carbon (HCO3(-)) transporter